MNILVQGMIYALFIWGLFYEWKFFLIYISILAIYELTARLLQKKYKNRTRQKIGAYSWDSPSKPNCLVSFDCEFNRIDNYIKAFNEKNPDHKISFTVIGLKAIGEAMKLGFNKTYSFGTIKDLERRVCVLVAVEGEDGKNLYQISVDDPSSKNYKEIKENMKGKIGKIKSRTDKNFKSQMQIAKLLPTFLLQASMNVSIFLSYALGISFQPMKVKANNFGSVCLTNTMAFPVEKGFPPHVEVCNTNFLLTLCYPSERVVVEEDKPVIKKMFSVAMDFDQRFGIGEDIVKAVQKIKDVFENPEKYDLSK